MPASLQECAQSEQESENRENAADGEGCSQRLEAENEHVVHEDSDREYAREESSLASVSIALF